MGRDDAAYLERRVEEELQAAMNSVDRAVASAHYRLAGLYLDRLYGLGDQVSHLTAAGSRGWKV